MLDAVAVALLVLLLRQALVRALAVAAERLRGDRNHQVVAGVNGRSAHVVGFPYGIQRGVILQGDRRQRFAAANLVALPAQAIVFRYLGQRGRKIGCDLQRHVQAVRAVRVGGPAVETGIEGVQRVEFDAGKLRRQREVELALDINLGELRLVFDARQLEVVLRRILDDIDQRHQSRHVGAGFLRQLQVPEIGGLAACFVTAFGPQDVAFTRVV